MSESRMGKTTRIGNATMACPKCGRLLDTDDALPPDQLPNGLRFRGLYCHGCGESFTVELTERPPE